MIDEDTVFVGEYFFEVVHLDVVHELLQDAFIAFACFVEVSEDEDDGLIGREVDPPLAFEVVVSGLVNDFVSYAFEYVHVVAIDDIYFICEVIFFIYEKFDDLADEAVIEFLDNKYGPVCSVGIGSGLLVVIPVLFQCGIYYHDEESIKN